MGVFVLNRLSHVSHLSDVGLTDFAIPFLSLRWMWVTPDWPLSINSSALV